MHNKKIFRVGRRIQIKDITKNACYNSIIEEYSEESFSIGIPFGEQGVLVTHENEAWDFCIAADSEQFYFKSKVLGRKKENIPMYIIQMPTEIRRVQLRNFVRVDITLDVYYEVIDGFGHSKPLNWYEPNNKAIGVDLSGGGMRLTLKEEIPVGSLMALRFELSKGTQIKDIITLARVKRIQQVIINGLNRYQVGVEFEEIPEAKRDEIIGFVFKKMLERKSLDE